MKQTKAFVAAAAIAISVPTCTLANDNNTFFDYETGETVDLTQPGEGNPSYRTWSEGNATMVEYTIRYAKVVDSPYYEGTVDWTIPTMQNYVQSDVEVLPPVPYAEAMPKVNGKDLKISVASAEYKDFPNYKLSPIDPMMPDCIDCPPVYFEIEPYTGFYPENIYETEAIYDVKPNMVSVLFFPVQYDYEHSIVRAYTKVVLKIESDITSIHEIEEAEASDAVYYNLQGIKINTPRHGHVYIEHRGDKYQQIIY